MNERNCTPKKVIVINSKLIAKETMGSSVVSWSDFLEIGKSKKLGRDETGEIRWKRLSFNWPLWILFSSGTTGDFFYSRRYGRSLSSLIKELRETKVRPDRWDAIEIEAYALVFS